MRRSADSDLGLVLEPHWVQETGLEFPALPGVEVVQFHDRLAPGEPKLLARKLTIAFASPGSYMHVGSIDDDR